MMKHALEQKRGERSGKEENLLFFFWQNRRVKCEVIHAQCIACVPLSNVVENSNCTKKVSLPSVDVKYKWLREEHLLLQHRLARTHSRSAAVVMTAGNLRCYTAIKTKKKQLLRKVMRFCLQFACHSAIEL